jgi:hypothetical protein
MRIKEIVVDSADPPSLARFWAAALEGYEVRAYDEEEIARLAALGLTPETDPTVLVDGPGPSLCFHTMAKPQLPRSPIHLDVVGGARAEEVARLTALGASVRDERDGYTVMLDPEGNPFCVQDPG